MTVFDIHLSVIAFNVAVICFIVFANIVHGCLIAIIVAVIAINVAVVAIDNTVILVTFLSLTFMLLLMPLIFLSL